MEINLDASVKALPVHVVTGPPPLKGNHLRFEFKMCEVPDVESPVSTPCGRAYRNSRAYRWAKLEQQDE